MADLPDVRTQTLFLLSVLHRRVMPPALVDCLALIGNGGRVAITSGDCERWLDLLTTMQDDADLRHYVLEHARPQELLTAQFAFEAVFQAARKSAVDSEAFQAIARTVLSSPTFVALLRLALTAGRFGLRGEAD